MNLCHTPATAEVVPKVVLDSGFCFAILSHMSNLTIHILHKPTNTYLCKDGLLRRCVVICGTKDDTLMYRTVGHALRRLNSVKPFKRIRKDMLEDTVLDVVETGVVGGFRAYRLDRFGKVLDDGHGGNSHEYATA